MATATERAAIGAQEARMEGKGPGGQAAEGLRNIATGRDDGLPGRNGNGPFNNNVGERGLGHTGAGPFNNTVEDRDLRHPGAGPFDNGRERGLFDRDHDHHHGGILGNHEGMTGHHNGGMLGHTEEEMARLRTKTHITSEGDAYCPNPNVRDLVSRNEAQAIREQSRLNLRFN